MTKASEKINNQIKNMTHINITLKIKSLFNTSGKSYRALGAEKVNKMNQKEAILALTNDPKLIKRPFLLTRAISLPLNISKQFFIP